MKYLLCLFACFLYVLGPAQNKDINSKSDSVKQAKVEWPKTEKYNYITSFDYFRKGMSDDEMAGFLMRKSDLNLKLGWTFLGISWVALGTSALMLNSQNRHIYLEAELLLVISFGIAVAVIPITIAGFHRMHQAVIVKQHKKYILKLSATGVSMNF